MPRPTRQRGAAGDGEQSSTSEMPMVEIFGGIFALLLVLFLLMNLLSQASVAERLEQAADEGLYRVGWGQNGAGYVVLAFPEEIRIVETGATVAAEDVCEPESAFVAYARRTYQAERQQLIFAVLEGGVATLAAARACMIRVLPGRELAIGWIIATDELLKSVALDDIPPFIRKALDPA